MFLLAELFYRLVWMEPPMTEVVEGNHPIYHHVPKAFLNGGLGKYDYRGRKYETEKAPGTIRISFIGDSFTYGFTPADQTIPFHLDRKIRERFPGMKVEVLNFGFVSYSPIIEEVVYRRLVHPLQSDYVFLLYDTFDVQDDILYAKMATFDESGAPLVVAGEEYLKTGIRSSALVRFLLYAYQIVKNDWNYLATEQLFSSRLTYFTEPKTFQWVIDYSFGIVKRIAGRVRDDGGRFMLFQYPPPHFLKDVHEFRNYLGGWGINVDYWEAPEKSPFVAKVLAFCGKENLTCHDFSPEVRRLEAELGETGSRLKLYNNEDGHFTGFVNDVFADFILEKMIADGFGAGENAGSAGSPPAENRPDGAETEPNIQP